MLGLSFRHFLAKMPPPSEMEAVVTDIFIMQGSFFAYFLLEVSKKTLNYGLPIAL